MIINKIVSTFLGTGFRSRFKILCSSFQQTCMPSLYTISFETSHSGIKELLKEGSSLSFLFILKGLQYHVKLVVILGQDSIVVSALLILIPAERNNEIHGHSFCKLTH